MLLQQQQQQKGVPEAALLESKPVLPFVRDPGTAVEKPNLAAAWAARAGSGAAAAGGWRTNICRGCREQVCLHRSNQKEIIQQQQQQQIAEVQ